MKLIMSVFLVRIYILTVLNAMNKTNALNVSLITLQRQIILVFKIAKAFKQVLFILINNLIRYLWKLNNIKM